MSRTKPTCLAVLLGLGLFASVAGAQDITAVRFTPDGKHVIATGLDGSIRRLDAVTGKELSRAKAHPNGVYALAVSHDGKTAVTGGADSKIILWELPDLKHTKEWTAAGQVLGLSLHAKKEWV